MPSVEIIIADSSPLIGLARIGRLELLPKLAARIIIPEAVWKEVVASNPDAPGAKEISQLAVLEIKSVDPLDVAPLTPFLGAGESEAIVLARQTKDALLLLDDLRARKFAARLGLRLIGTLGLLAQAKQQGFITQVRPAVEQLAEHNIFLNSSLVEAILKEVGE